MILTRGSDKLNKSVSSQERCAPIGQHLIICDTEQKAKYCFSQEVVMHDVSLRSCLLMNVLFHTQIDQLSINQELQRLVEMNL